MKKLWITLAAVTLVAALCATGALAAGHHGRNLRYTDANGDGICDNYGTGCGSFADADGDGICDYHGAGCGSFADADGDGICDNYGTGLGSHHGGRGGYRNR